MLKINKNPKDDSYSVEYQDGTVRVCINFEEMIQYLATYFSHGEVSHEV